MLGLIAALFLQLYPPFTEDIEDYLNPGIEKVFFTQILKPITDRVKTGDSLETTDFAIVAIHLSATGKLTGVETLVAKNNGYFFQLNEVFESTQGIWHNPQNDSLILIMPLYAANEGQLSQNPDLHSSKRETYLQQMTTDALEEIDFQEEAHVKVLKPLFFLTYPALKCSMAAK